MTKNEVIETEIKADEEKIKRKFTDIERLLWMSGFASGRIYQLNSVIEKLKA